MHTFKELVNSYSALPKFKIKEFIEKTEALNFTVIFLNSDVESVEEFVRRLEEPYPHDLNLTFKSFQLRGFNYVKDLDSAIINWSTGTGKSVLAVAMAKHLLETNQVDKVVVLSKRHNKINWKRSLDKFGNLASVADNEISAGSAEKMREARGELYEHNQIFIINYEKMDGDFEQLKAALKDKRVLWVWDEMPNKMKSMRTRWYKAAQKLLQITSGNRQLELTAKKLDTDPENVYSCVKILDPTV